MKEKVEKILASKGYVFDETCDAVATQGVVFSQCFGSSNTYLTLRLGYAHKTFFLKGTWPVTLNASVIHQDARSVEGYYYEVPSYKVAKFQSYEYYDQLLLQEASAFPRCKDLVLQN